MRSDPAFKVHKFSTKPPGHETARQRENQRRHRARVKGRITELEGSLLTTQSKLSEALRCIDDLKTEVDRLRQALRTRSRQGQGLSAGQVAVPASPTLPTALDILAQVSFDSSPVDLMGVQSERSCDASRSELFDGSTGEAGDAGPYVVDDCGPLTIPTICPTLAHSLNGESDSSNITAAVSETVIGDDPNDDCPMLPAPSPGESTMPCREAYSLIKGSILPPGFDFDQARDWLKPGFRCATVPGSGCRVQTHILFSFVDHITST